MVGGLVRFMHGQISGAENPFPSPADILYVVGYALLIFGTVQFGHLRSRERGGDGVGLDALIVGAGAALLEWGIVLAPFMRDHDVPTATRVLTAGYSVMTIVLLAVVLRLAVGPGARTASFYLLVVGITMTFVADLASNLSANGRNDYGLSQILPIFIFTCFGASSDHPDAPLLTAPPTDRVQRLSWRRLTMLGAALIMAPSFTLWELAHSNGVDLPVVLIGWVLLAGLVLVRLADLVRSKERAALHEGILRHANAVLATATSRAEMNTGALEAVGALIEADKHNKNGWGFGAYTGLMRPDGLEVLHAIRQDVARIGTVVSLDDLPVSLRIEALNPDWHWHRRSSVMDPNAGAHREAKRVISIALRVQGEVRGAIVVTTGRDLTSETRRVIEQLGSTLSLALESAALMESLHRAQSERRFRALVENSSDIVVVADRTGTLTFARPGLPARLGGQRGPGGGDDRHRSRPPRRPAAGDRGLVPGRLR